MDKIELIDLITDFHPDSEAGRKRGLCHYTGGMKDSGDWYYKKLLKLSGEELKVLYDELKEEWKPKPQIQYSEQDKKDMATFTQTKSGIIMSDYERKQWTEWFTNYETGLLGL